MGARRSNASLCPASLLVLLGLIISLTCHGCGRKSAPAVSFSGRPPRVAHVFTARLMNEHPLYEQYRRLEQEIAALRRPCVVPALSPLFLDMGELIIPGPEPPSFPLEQFTERRHDWELTLLPPPTPPPSDLAPDLAARLRWAEARAKEQTSEQLAAVRNEQDSIVAAVRAKAVRDRQEALNNVGLDLTIKEADLPEATERERRRLWAEIEAEVSAARAAADQRIKAARQRLVQQEARGVAESEAEIRGLMRKRLEISLKSGSETKSRMSNAITPPQAPPMQRQVAWSPQVSIASAAALRPSVPALAASDQRLRMAQAARLAAQRAKLGSEILEAVAVASQRLAGLQGMTLSFPPGERAAGRDVTEQIRPQLRQMYTP
ncbi:MAG: hypothetical protein ABFE08_11130 [Armatimonadia bacterium]